MYRIIRVGEGYCLVIVEDLSTQSKFYRYADWRIGEYEPYILNEIPSDQVPGYFSGHADGLGFEILPEHTFDSLDSVTKFIEGKVLNYHQERQKDSPYSERIAEFQRTKLIKSARDNGLTEEKIREGISRLPDGELKTIWIGQFLEIYEGEERESVEKDLLEYLVANPPLI